MSVSFFRVCVLVGLGIGSIGCGKPSAGNASSASPSAAPYTCPMHPEIVQDGPGRCPKCGMNLEPKPTK